MGVDFDTQSGLQLSADHKFLHAVSSADDKVGVISATGSSLLLIQKIYRWRPAAEHHITCWFWTRYVLDGSLATMGISGFRVDAATGLQSPINNATIATSTPIGVPVTVLFSPDGKSILVTNKVDSTIDVFSIEQRG